MIKKTLAILALAMMVVGTVYADGMDTDATADFFAAVKASDEDAVKNFLDSGAVLVDVQEADGNTALMIACEMEDLDMVLALVPYQPSVSITNNAGQTAPDIAATKGNIALTSALNGL